MQRTALLLLLSLPSLAQHQANGLKVGEVSQTEAVVWTRLTQNPERGPVGDWPDAVPGTEGEVRLVYGPRGLPSTPVETPWIAVDPEADYTHQFRLTGLAPGTGYFLRTEARALGGDEVTSRVGAVFLTAAEKAATQPLTFTVTTCQGFHRRDDATEGHRIYRHMAGFEPAFWVHCGDVVYYDKPDPWAKDVATARYKWNRMFALPLQRELHRRSASYFLRDDHDTLKNDCWPGQKYGEITWEEGMALFDEQVPKPKTRYRNVRWGADLEVWLLEGRAYRSPNNMADGPDKTILGEEQRRWLEETLRLSDASFKVVISATPIVGPDRSSKADNHSNKAFQTEGEWLRALLAGQENTFAVCGDRHWQYVSRCQTTGLVEFACGPSSDAHAGGFNGVLQPEHDYLAVRGGFLSVEVARDWGRPHLTFRHHDVAGQVVNEVRFE